MRKKKTVEEAQAEPVRAEPPKQVTINYIKTSGYRCYHVDGVFGGVTPHGKIYAQMFVERAVTPQIVDYEVNSEGGLGKELQRVGRQGWVREIESGFIMDLNTAQVLIKWLQEKVKTLEGLTEPPTTQKAARRKKGKGER